MEDNKETAIIEVKPENGLAKPTDAIQVKRPGEDLDLVVSGMVPGAGQIELTEKQIGILYAPTEDEDVEIRPDGLVYLPWMNYVTRMRQAFGLNWSIIPKGEPRLGPNKTSILWGFYLVIQGKLAGYAIGEQAYQMNNPKMNWSDACEGAKSNALMRLCKGIGIGLELWKPSFIRAWKEKYAETYIDQETNKKLWRKKNGGQVVQPLGPDIAATPAEQPDVFEFGDGDAEKSQMPKPKEEPSLFFTDEEVSQKPVGQLLNSVVKSMAPKEKPIYDEGTREAIINAIKEALKAEQIDESEFRAWLDIYQVGCTPPRHFVGRMGKNLRFHMGDGGDLKFLYNKIGESIVRFKKFKGGLAK